VVVLVCLACYEEFKDDDAKVAYDAEQYLRANAEGESQVKHPEDIPIACAFVQKFGGGMKGQYIADLAKFVALCVPANRKVEASKSDAFKN